VLKKVLNKILNILTRFILLVGGLIWIILTITPALIIGLFYWLYTGKETLLKATKITFWLWDKLEDKKWKN